MKRLNLNENFICRIWEENSFYKDLRTTEEEQVVILDYGRKNFDAGPDYRDARVSIGGKIYTGSVEIHRSENDWHQHRHKGDNKYNDVILHVAFYSSEDEISSAPAIAKRSRRIPTVYLSEFLTRSIHEIWREIIENPSPSFQLPCFEQNKSVPRFIVKEWIENLAAKRLMLKCMRMDERLRELHIISGDDSKWEQALFEFTCEALGYSKNKEQMLALSRRIQLKDISNIAQDVLIFDSVCFGLAGFLNDLRFKDDYIIRLKSEWNKMKNVLMKETMNKSEWNFFRLRPQNFPTVRIAYAAALLYEISNKDFFKRLIRTFETSQDLVSDIESLMKDIEISPYWKNHFMFGKVTPSTRNVIGSERIIDILVNVFLPLVRLYSGEEKNRNLESRVEFFYKNKQQSRGRNEVVRVMEKQLHYEINSVSEEQGLIHLHNFFCVRGKCKDCEIGKSVFCDERVKEPLKIILY